MKRSLFNRAKTRYRMVRKVLTVFLLLSMLVFTGVDVLAAGNAPKGRLTTGWLADEAMENLRCNDNWLYVSMGMMFVNMIYDQLWMMGPPPDYDPKPWLATSWETTDGKTWRFHLRKDVKFHDGVAVTAKDVAFTMEYLTNSVPSFKWHGTVIEPGSAKVIDDYTVEFTLPTPLGGKYAAAFWIPILPKHLFEPYKDNVTEFPNEKAIGSGPFKIKEFKPGEYIWFVANENYWGEIPKVGEVVWRVYGSPDAQAMAMRKGEIQMFGYAGTSVTVAKRLQGKENIDLIISPGPSVSYLVFNLYKKGPVQDLNVRKAIMHSINRKRIIDMAFRGYAEIIDSVVYPEMEDHNPNLPQYEYDPEKAKNILDAAGYVDSDDDGLRNDPKTGQELSLGLILSTLDPTTVRAMQMVAEQLKDVGIEIILKTYDESTFSSLHYAPNKNPWDIAASGLQPGPYGDWTWEIARSWEGGGEGWNSAYYNNLEFDKALDAMLGERDLKKRKELLFSMQRMFAEDLPYSFLWRLQTFDPIRTDKFEGHVKAMGGLSVWWNPWSYYYLKPKK